MECFRILRFKFQLISSKNIFINLPGVNPVFESGGGYSSRSFVGGTSPFDKHLNSSSKENNHYTNPFIYIDIISQLNFIKTI